MAKQADAYKSGMRGDEKPKRGALRSVRIDEADGGYTVECTYEPVRGTKKDPMGFYDPPKPKVFEKLDDALSWTREAFAGNRQPKDKK